MLPVAQRELLVGSRRRTGLWVRLVPAGICLLLWVLLFSVASNFIPQPGANGFKAMSALAFVFCLLSGFFFTADAISAERREGTLPLLFHAQTAVADVTLGKFLGLSLLPFYGLVAVLPFFALPMLDGGVTRGWVGQTVLALMGTMFFSLAAGFLASIFAREDDAGYLGTCLYLVAPTVPFGLGVVGLLAWKARRAELSRRGRMGLACAGLAAVAVGTTAVAAGNLFNGSPTVAWVRAMGAGMAGMGGPAGFWAALLNIVVVGVVYLAAAILLIQPRSCAGEENSERRAGRGFVPGLAWDRAEPMRSFVKRQGTGAVVFVLFGAVLLLAISGVSMWLDYTRTAAAGGGVGGGGGTISVINGGDTVLQLLLSFAIARLAVTTMGTLKQNRMLETVLSTPVKLWELVLASRAVFWRTVAWALVASAAVQVVQLSFLLTYMPAGAAFTVWSLVQIVMWIPFYAAVFWVGNYFALRQRSPGAAAVWTLGVTFLVPMIATMVFSFVLFGVLMAAVGGISYGMGSEWIAQLIYQGTPNLFMLAMYLGLIFWAKKKLRFYNESYEWREKI